MWERAEARRLLRGRASSMLAASSEGVLSTGIELWRRLQEAGRAYGAGDKEAARASYLAVWEEARAAGDDYHACAAAHMLGVFEPTPAEEKLKWHRRALACADRAGSATGPAGPVASWRASLYGNLGYASRLLGRLEDARRYYEEAWRHVGALPQSAYGETVRADIERALGELTGGSGSGSDTSE